MPYRCVLDTAGRLSQLLLPFLLIALLLTWNRCFQGTGSSYFLIATTVIILQVAIKISSDHERVCLACFWSSSLLYLILECYQNPLPDALHFINFNIEIWKHYLFVITRNRNENKLGIKTRQPHLFQKKKKKNYLNEKKTYLKWKINFKLIISLKSEVMPFGNFCVNCGLWFWFILRWLLNKMQKRTGSVQKFGFSNLATYGLTFHK